MHAPSVHSEPLESLVVKRQHDNDDAQPRGYHAIMNTVLLAAIAVLLFVVALFLGLIYSRMSVLDNYPQQIADSFMTSLKPDIPTVPDLVDYLLCHLQDYQKAAKDAAQIMLATFGCDSEDSCKILNERGLRTPNIAARVNQIVSSLQVSANITAYAAPVKCGPDVLPPSVADSSTLSLFSWAFGQTNPTAWKSASSLCSTIADNLSKMPIQDLGFPGYFDLVPYNELVLRFQLACNITSKTGGGVFSCADAPAKWNTTFISTCLEPHLVYHPSSGGDFPGELRLSDTEWVPPMEGTMGKLYLGVQWGLYTEDDTYEAQYFACGSNQGDCNSPKIRVFTDCLKNEVFKDATQLTTSYDPPTMRYQEERLWQYVPTETVSKQDDANFVDFVQQVHNICASVENLTHANGKLEL